MTSKRGDVVLTPLRCSTGGKVLRIARMSPEELDEAQVQHIAGGPYKGIIISKAANETPSEQLPDTSRSFVAHCREKDHDAGQEQRKLRFWFKKSGKKPKPKTWEKNTEKFVRDLIYGEDFPRDYIGFVKRVLELMKEHSSIERLELEICPLATASQEDQQVHLGGASASAHGTLQNGGIESSATPQSGASLDPSARSVPSQDDQLKKQQIQQGYTTEADFEHADRAGTAHGPALVAATKATTGATGNRSYLEELTKEEEVLVAQKAPNTGGARGNPNYLAELQSTETVEERAVAQPAAPLGSRGSVQYDAELRRAELLKAAGAGPAPGTEVDQRIHEEAPVTVTGSRGSAAYEAELRRSTRVSATGQEDLIPEPALVSQTTPLLGGTEGNVDYASQLQGQVRTTKVTTKTVRTVQGVSTEQVVEKTSTTSTGSRGSSAYESLLKAGMSQEDQQKLLEAEMQATLQGANVSYSTSTPGKGAALKPKLVISRRGWHVIWAARKQKLLNILEDAYPNILSVEDMVRTSHMKRHDCEYLMQDIGGRGLVKEIEKGRWMRLQKKAKAPHTDTDQPGGEEVSGRKHDFQVVQDVPKLPDNLQPVVAIVTLLYCEKLAVDSMMDPKTTYIRYKTEGESQVYTVGVIGKHRVVSTKLSRVGRAREARTAAGNTVTRLLGIFGKVEYVILLGVGGGIVNVRDDRSHVRLGDVVVSKPEYPGSPVYINCTGVKRDATGGANFSTQSWTPKDDILDKLVTKLDAKIQQAVSRSKPSWEAFIEEGREELQSGETRFTRPGPETDKLYKVVQGTVLEVPHPEIMEGSPRALRPDVPVLHYGVVGCGKDLRKDDSLKQEFALFNEVKAIDLGYKAVMESVEGNRKDSFIVIRGVSDYEDGTKKKEWQPYAALAAAAYMKALVLEIPAEEEEDY